MGEKHQLDSKGFKKNPEKPDYAAMTWDYCFVIVAMHV